MQEDGPLHSLASASQGSPPDRARDGYRGLQKVGETLVRIRWMDGEGQNVKAAGWFWQVGHGIHGPFASSGEAFGGAARALEGQDE